MSDITIEVHRREDLGKNANRRLRAAGQVPAVVYGDGKDSMAIQVGRRTLEDLLRKSSAGTPIFLLKLAGTDQTRHAMIRDMQLDAMTDEMVHIDFQRIRMDQKVHLTVPIEVHGVAIGVKTDGGLLDFITRELEIECLPSAIPNHLEVDVTALHIGQHIEAGQVELPEGVTLLDDEDKVIVSIAQPRSVAEDDEDEGDELLERAASEPEVIKRGKDDD